MDDWDTALDALQRVFAENPEIPSDTRENAVALLALMRPLWPPPWRVGRGYWPTLCLSWPGSQIEVFDDRIELYRFFQGRTDIREAAWTATAPLPQIVIEMIPR